MPQFDALPFKPWCEHDIVGNGGWGFCIENSHPIEPVEPEEPEEPVDPLEPPVDPIPPMCTPEFLPCDDDPNSCCPGTACVANMCTALDMLVFILLFDFHW